MTPVQPIALLFQAKHTTGASSRRPTYTPSGTRSEAGNCRYPSTENGTFQPVVTCGW